MDPNKLPGSLKIAILIQSMSEEASQVIINSLDEKEREVVSNHMAQMGSIPPDLVEKVVDEFTESTRHAKNRKRLGIPEKDNKENGEEYIKRINTRSASLGALLSLDSDKLYELVKDEHPQTIAIIMVHVKTRIASDVLSRLPDETKKEVAFRVANLDKVMAEMIEEVNSAFEDIIDTMDSSISNAKGGTDRVAEILNQTDEMSSEYILNEIEENDPEMAAEIKQKMFVFEDLPLVDDRGFQKLLRKVETSELAIALKAATEDVKEKVFKNMSSRAGEMLKEEMDDLGPVRMKEVSDVQQRITAMIQDMEVKGELIISGRRGDDMVT
ncbi:MAG: flagellar motor switch protein FliG [Thermodesulfobacteriota bacterium]|nr:flagellar motor switch protein FliG [Thermodesulfobacteriota bacterium]